MKKIIIDKKKILKEFLKLKWQETKWIWAGSIPFALIWFYISHPFTLWADDFNRPSDAITLIGGFMVTLIIMILLAAISVSIYSLVQWLKDNWKQATYNMYPHLKPKKKLKKK